MHLIQILHGGGSESSDCHFVKYLLSTSCSLHFQAEQQVHLQQIYGGIDSNLQLWRGRAGDARLECSSAILPRYEGSDAFHSQ